MFDAGQWEVTNSDRWGEEKERTRRAVEGDGPSMGQSGNSQSGIEALAWYVSFHDDQRAWGIYIPLSSLTLMDELYLSELRMERERRFQLAWSILLSHERMHFAVDYACAWFELMLRAPIRREFMERFNSKPLIASALASEAYLEVEETAANAHMLRELSRTRPRQIMRTIEKFVEKQPSGYREGRRAVGDIEFAEAVANTLRSYLALWAFEHRLDLGNGAMNLARLLPLGDQNVLAECPVYAIDDLNDVGVAPGSVRLIRRISEIVETERFEKQLGRVDDAIRRDWSRLKERIKDHLPSSPRFEKLKNWEPPTWSVRLRDGYRVHLCPSENGAVTWHAVGIGTHKEMGHG